MSEEKMRIDEVFELVAYDAAIKVIAVKALMNAWEEENYQILEELIMLEVENIKKLGKTR